MNILLEGIFLLFGVPVVIFVVAFCWVTVIIALMKLVNRLGKWFEGRKKPVEADTKIDAVKPEQTKKEQETTLEILIGDSDEQYTCPLCKYKNSWGLFMYEDECPACGESMTLAILQWQHYTKEIASIKRWLKGRNIPTETKDELRRRLNKIGGV